MSEQQLEIYRQHRTAQDKYTYFLLAAAGAAIGFAANQTQTSRIARYQLPLACAVLFWGFSFYFGCRHLEYVNSTLLANAELLKAQQAQDYGAVSALRRAVDHNSDKSNELGKKQFRSLIWGFLFYIVWHVWEMWLRTYPHA